MQTRTNSVNVLATLMMIGCLEIPPHPLADAVWEASGFGSEISTAGDHGVRLVAMAEWGQHLPVLPAGSSIRMKPAPAVQLDPFRVPVGAESPSPRRRVDGAKVERTTTKLQSLLKAVQPELAGASKGQLPRDLIPNLKRIEKLCKQLRREVGP